MGIIGSVVKRTAKAARQGAQAATAVRSECVGCGKPLRSTKKNVCSVACVDFVGRSY
jgi:hypothetical protein